MVEQFNMKSKLLTLHYLTVSGLEDAFDNDTSQDLELIEVAISLVGLYCIIFLGSCSPIHCRFLIAIVGLGCVFIAYATGFSICFALDYKAGGVHELIPFLLIGIGVDDLFVLVNALD